MGSFLWSRHHYSTCFIFLVCSRISLLIALNNPRVFGFPHSYLPSLGNCEISLLLRELLFLVHLEEIRSDSAFLPFHGCETLGELFQCSCIFLCL